MAEILLGQGVSNIRENRRIDCQQNIDDSSARACSDSIPSRGCSLQGNKPVELHAGLAHFCNLEMTRPKQSEEQPSQVFRE